MPTGLIEQHNGVAFGFYLGADHPQVLIHRLSVAVGHNQAGGRSFLGADRAEDIGRLGALILGRGWPGSPASPAARDFVFLPDAGFILEPDLDPGPFGELVADFLDPEGENLA